MNYDDAIEIQVSAVEARREIAKHDCDGWEAFVEDCGAHDFYSGATVLGWLGY